MGGFSKYDTVQVCKKTWGEPMLGFVTWEGTLDNKGITNNYRLIQFVNFKNTLQTVRDANVVSCRIVLTEKYNIWRYGW